MLNERGGFPNSACVPGRAYSGAVPLRGRPSRGREAVNEPPPEPQPCRTFVDQVSETFRFSSPFISAFGELLYRCGEKCLPGLCFISYGARLFHFDAQEIYFDEQQLQLPPHYRNGSGASQGWGPRNGLMMATSQHRLMSDSVSKRGLQLVNIGADARDFRGLGGHRRRGAWDTRQERPLHDLHPLRHLYVAAERPRPSYWGDGENGCACSQWRVAGYRQFPTRCRQPHL